MGRAAFWLIWLGLGLALALPLAEAAVSPLLQYRQPIYVAAGFAGIAGLGLLLVQPLLARGRLPGLNVLVSRNLHRVVGILLVTLVLIHVIGLWVTSPPDVVDALLFRSPTPFSIWGVLAMWAVFAASGLTLFRRRLRLRLWRNLHLSLVTLTVTGTVVHAIQIEGTMGWITKYALCLVVVLALIYALFGQRLRPGRATTGSRP